MVNQSSPPPLTSLRQTAGRPVETAIGSETGSGSGTVTDLTALLQKAAAASPSRAAGASGGRWVKLLPVFRTLIRRGFGGTAAVDWLIEQGEISKVDRKRAFYALLQALHRWNEREQTASHALPKEPPLSEPAPVSSRQF